MTSHDILKTLFDEFNSGNILPGKGFQTASIAIPGFPNAEIVLDTRLHWFKIFPEGQEHASRSGKPPQFELSTAGGDIWTKTATFAVMDKRPYRQIMERVSELEDPKQVPQKKILIDPDLLICLVNMFDQMNTGGGVARIFEGRGVKMEKAVGELRQTLITVGHPPILNAEQAK